MLATFVGGSLEGQKSIRDWLPVIRFPLAVDMPPPCKECGLTKTTSLEYENYRLEELYFHENGKIVEPVKFYTHHALTVKEAFKMLLAKIE